MGIIDIEPVCGGTLVVHGDGSHDCEHDARCGADRLLHEHVVDCAELGCRCDAPVLVRAA